MTEEDIYKNLVRLKYLLHRLAELFPLTQELAMMEEALDAAIEDLEIADTDDINKTYAYLD